MRRTVPRASSHVHGPVITRWMRVAVLCLCVAMTGPPALARDVVDRVLASVGGRIVTMSDVRMVREFGLVNGDTANHESRATLEQLIDRMLILDEVERYAPAEPSEAEVIRRLNGIRGRFSQDAYTAAMKVTGTDEAAIMQWVRNDLRIDAYLNQRFASVVEPTGEDLERYVREVDTEAERSNRHIPDDEVKRLARERAVAERRQALIREWIEGLRRRTSISYPQSDH